MGSINWFYVYDQLKISQLFWKSLLELFPTTLGYKQKASIHRPAFPRDSNKVGWQATQ